MSVTPEDIKLQLIEALPQYTDEFGDTVTASAVTDSGVIKVTASSHGLSTDDIIVNSNVKVTLPVTSVTYDSATKTAEVTLSAEHDRTSGSGNIGGYNIASFQGFDDANYNGDFEVITATRTSVVISAEADVVGALGEMVEERGLYLGYTQVTKIDTNNFTIPVKDGLPNGISFETFKYSTEQRIYIAADITRAVTTYAQRRDKKPSLFIVFDETSASKDRSVINDAVTTTTTQNPARLKYITQVSLHSFAITKTEQLAATKQQQIYSEIVPALKRAMYGVVFNSDQVSKTYAAIEISNSPESWNQGYYVHHFQYQIPYDLTIEQGFVSKRNVSFRNIVLESTIFDTEGDLATLDAEIPI